MVTITYLEMLAPPARASATAARSIITDPRVEIYLLRVAGAPAGFAELDRRVKGEVELS